MTDVAIRFLEHYRVRIPCKDGTHPAGDWDYRWALPATNGERVEIKDALQVGDAYWSIPHESKCYTWDNCKGRHLIVICPGDFSWNVDGRASNCTLKEDRLHRCWVRSGDPAIAGSLHVDKNGLTCQAGAGSIQAPGGWHGFLHNGRLSEQG